MKNDSRIKQAVLNRQRHPHNTYDINGFRTLHEFQQRLFGFAQQAFLHKQIHACISGHRQFGEHDPLYALLFRPANHLFDLHCIVMAVGHPYRRHTGRYFHISVFHHRIVFFGKISKIPNTLRVYNIKHNV